MGPMELADYVGLDTTKFIIDGMFCSHVQSKTKVHLCPSDSMYVVSYCCLAKLMICAWAQRRLFLVQFFSVGGCASSYSYLPAQIIRNFP